MFNLIKRCFSRLSISIISVLGISLFYMGTASAKSAQDFNAISDNIKGQFNSIVQLVTAGAYVFGTGMILVAIFKFKQHKDSPTQQPVGGPIALLFVGAALLFLPTIFGAAGASIFGSSGEIGGTQGVYSFGGWTGDNMMDASS